jgi:hypothetical protein
MLMHTERKALLVCLIVSLLSGCSKPGPLVVEVQGKVTYNGKPVAIGTVKFVPVSQSGELIRPAAGPIAADGSYSMQSFPSRSGSRPGEYQVAVVSYTGSFMDGTAKYVVPKRYADPQTSGLTVTVPAEAKEPLTLDLHLVD